MFGERLQIKQIFIGESARSQNNEILFGFEEIIRGEFGGDIPRGARQFLILADHGLG